MAPPGIAGDAGDGDAGGIFIGVVGFWNNTPQCAAGVEPADDAESINDSPTR